MRQFTFYVLTKSYADIAKDVEAQDAPPDRDKFISDLKVSTRTQGLAESSRRFRSHLVRIWTDLLTPDDILHVPEFLLAYQRTNSGGVTNGIPKPKYVDADKTAHPDRYQKQHDEYFAALKKFIQTHPESVSGMELELTARKSASKVVANSVGAQETRAAGGARGRADEISRGSDGHGPRGTRGASPILPAGNYWISTLNLDAGAGDTRLRWDVPVSIQAGRSTRIELTNLNATDAHGSTP